MTRRALLLLLGSIALCSCAKQLPPAPVIVTVPIVECPAPPRPQLPEIDAALPLDSPVNVEAIMTRDDVMRGYIRGLESCVECYGRQVR
jgi:hypothetical protein